MRSPLSSMRMSAAVLIDENGVIVEASDAFSELVGLHRATGRRYRDLLSEGMRRRWNPLCKDDLSRSEKIEEHFFFNGSTAMIRFTLIELPGRGPTFQGIVLGFGRSEQRTESRHSSRTDLSGDSLAPATAATIACLNTRIDQLEQQLESSIDELYIDPLTGLKNKAGLNRRIQSEILSSVPEGMRLALVVADIDNFKTVNHIHGYPAGDRLLRTVGRRLQAPGSVVCVARIGGDKFGLLVRLDGSTGSLDGGWDKILSRIFKPVTVRGVLVGISGSAGVSVYGVDAYDAEDLFANADAALLEARRLGKRRAQIFDTKLAARTRRRKVLFRDLKLAIAEGLLHPVYHPILSTSRPGFVGVEVLSRWVHHEFGSVPPDEFISIAAECGLLYSLDLGMAATACAELHDLLATGALKFVAFNLSPLQLSHQEYVDALLSILHAADIAPDRVCVEVTENELIPNFEAAKQSIQTLKAAGITIVLDDYGTGYSNLRTLLDLPIDVIKIDKSLIFNVAKEERAMQVVLSVVHLARVLGAQLVAEGIESNAQAVVTKALGCHYVQGFLFSKPMRLSGLEEWLRQNAKAVHGRIQSPNSRQNGQFKLVS